MEFDATAFDAATAAKLEHAVQQQLQSRSYDLAANKALLRNYSVHADQAKAEVVAAVLVLALMRLPNADFAILSSLLPTKLVAHKSVAAVSQCAVLLETGKYAEFWEAYVAHEGLFSAAAGFVENIRLFILTNLRDTYKAMPKELFSVLLGLNEASLPTFCSGNKFIQKVAEEVHFTKEEVKAEEKSGSFRLDEGLAVLSVLAR